MADRYDPRDGYDSDDDEWLERYDEWLERYDPRHAASFLEQFQNYYDEGRIGDRPFMLVSSKPVAKATLCYRGFAVNGADTAISLSPDLEDTLLVCSDTLKTSHEIFKVGLSAQWAHNKICESAEDIYGSGIKYLYELELDSNGESILVGKTAITPPSERRTKWAEAFAKFRFDCPYGQWEYVDKNQDIACPNAIGAPDEYLKVCTQVHNVGFAMICGFPLRLRRYPSSEAMQMIGETGFFFIKLAEWVHAYGDFKTMGPQLARLALGPSGYHEHIATAVSVYPALFLRLATLFQSLELFKLAMERLVMQHFWMIQVHGHQAAFDKLELDLKHDARLIARVATIASGLSALCSNVQARVDGLLYELHMQKDPVSCLAYEIVTSVSYTDTGEPVPMIDVMKEHHTGRKTLVSLGSGSVDAKRVIEEYRDIHSTSGSDPPQNTDDPLLHATVQGFLDMGYKIVQELRNGNGCYFGFGFMLAPRVCDLVGSLDFENYVYPWEKRERRSRSSLKDIMDAVRLEDAQAEDSEQNAAGIGESDDGESDNASNEESDDGSSDSE